jgi:hypothetical protein
LSVRWGGDQPIDRPDTGLKGEITRHDESPVHLDCGLFECRFIPQNISVYANNVLDKRYYSELGQSSLWLGAPAVAASLPRDASRYFGVGINTSF